MSDEHMFKQISETLISVLIKANIYLGTVLPNGSRKYLCRRFYARDLFIIMTRFIIIIIE